MREGESWTRYQSATKGRKITQIVRRTDPAFSQGRRKVEIIDKLDSERRKRVPRVVSLSKGDLGTTGMLHQGIL